MQEYFEYLCKNYVYLMNNPLFYKDLLINMYRICSKGNNEWKFNEKIYKFSIILN